MTVKDAIARSQDAIARSQAARHRAARTVARARFVDDLREAHCNGSHTDPERGVDPTGYWAEVGCPGCCAEIVALEVAS